MQDADEQNEDVEEESADLDVGVSINSLGKVFSVSGFPHLISSLRFFTLVYL